MKRDFCRGKAAKAESVSLDWLPGIAPQTSHIRHRKSHIAPNQSCHFFRRLLRLTLGVMGALPQLRRQALRQPVHSLSYVDLGRGNGGVVLDLSDTGVAVHAVQALGREQEPLGLEFHLLETSARVQARGEVVWAEQSGKTGIRFVEVTRFGRQRIKEWMLYNALSASESETAEAWTRKRHPDLAATAATSVAMRAAGLVDGAPREVQFVCEIPTTTDLPELRRLLARRLQAEPQPGITVLLASMLFASLVMQIAQAPPTWALALMLGLVAPLSFWWLYRLAAELWREQ